MLRKRTWVEQIASDTARLAFTESDRVVSVRVKNQGTATIYTGWNSESGNNQILPGSSDAFDAGDSGYIEGNLTVKFGPGTANAIILTLKDNCD